jgi:hypothetical protein
MLISADVMFDGSNLFREREHSAVGEERRACDVQGAVRR